ncbi:MAG TPA: hypothetical protein VFD43_02920 [Planctomycetota bacterium]|nr:hypothetical protein [Planctomycetota bacterium]
MKALVTSCLLLLVPASAASTWVVDAAGGGHFTSIQAAIDAAAPGDVLLVMSGNYAAFTLDKDLSILGPATGSPPFVPGESLLLMDNAAIAGLRFSTLEVAGAAGFVLLDEIHVDGNLVGGAACDGMRIEGCAQVHVARSLIHGKDGDEWCESRALGIVDSTVTLTGCTLVGGTGWGDDFFGYPGIEGLDIVGDSRVLLSQTSVFGGNGGTPEILFGGQGGWGAEAIRVSWSEREGPASCTVRGTGSIQIAGGQAGQGIGGQAAWTAATGYGTLTVSGVSYSPEHFGALLEVVMPRPAQPFVNLVGGDGPRAFKRLNLHGPDGTPLLVFASLHPALLSLPGPVDGAIWLDLATPVLILPVALLGQELPVNFTFSMPAALTGFEGLTVTFQGFAQGLGASGNHLATNPAHLLVR